MYLIFVLWDKNPYSLFSKCNDSEERRGDLMVGGQAGESK